MFRYIPSPLQQPFCSPQRSSPMTLTLAVVEVAASVEVEAAFTPAATEAAACMPDALPGRCGR